eukprot:2408852-Rhodomonas_salina.1
MGPDCSAVFFFSSPSSGILENLDALCLVISLGGADGAYVYRTAPASLLSCRICIVTYQFAGTRANAPILAIGGSPDFDCLTRPREQAQDFAESRAVFEPRCTRLSLEGSKLQTVVTRIYPWATILWRSWPSSLQILSPTPEAVKPLFMAPPSFYAT